MIEGNEAQASEMVKTPGNPDKWKRQIHLSSESVVDLENSEKWIKRRGRYALICSVESLSYENFQYRRKGTDLIDNETSFRFFYLKQIITFIQIFNKFQSNFIFILCNDSSLLLINI